MKKRKFKNFDLIIFATLPLTAILIFLSYHYLNNWNRSDEFKEMLRQEKALQLPKPDERDFSDKGCKWISTGDYWEGIKEEKYWSCERQIILTYNDIHLAGQIRDRLVANGWKEEGYHEHIGPTKQTNALSIDQIGQGQMPRRASHSNYYFSPKSTSYGDFCAHIYIQAQGDDRNPIRPFLRVHLDGLYGESERSCK